MPRTAVRLARNVIRSTWNRLNGYVWLSTNRTGGQVPSEPSDRDTNPPWHFVMIVRGTQQADPTPPRITDFVVRILDRILRVGSFTAPHTGCQTRITEACCIPKISLSRSQGGRYQVLLIETNPSVDRCPNLVWHGLARVAVLLSACTSQYSMMRAKEEALDALY